MSDPVVKAASIDQLPQAADMCWAAGMLPDVDASQLEAIAARRQDIRERAAWEQALRPHYRGTLAGVLALEAIDDLATYADITGSPEATQG